MGNYDEQKCVVSTSFPRIMALLQLTMAELTVWAQADPKEWVHPFELYFSHLYQTIFTYFYDF